ncbi:F-box protein At3g28330-like, partial [Raphanus sativus]|uniref:F-box protein At3g28330-like n=1 Tax=Raphanus sativus TaxID=3726 RepID=A0A9W3CLS2_RAPSA
MDNDICPIPLKSIASSKLVCKQWKSILESPFLRKLFLSRHQNSHSMWSLIVKIDHQHEAVAHYGGDIWGHPPQQLGSYIVPCITQTLINHKEKYRQARVVAYTDVGLILIRLVSTIGNVSLYVANPVSRECVETSPP